MQKSVLITGCSSGIGLCAAEILQEKGYRVFATARRAEDVEKLKSQGFESVRLDINDSHSIDAALQEILAKTDGLLYGLFNNAGFVQPGAIEDLSREALLSQFETNVFGPMELIKKVLPIMRKQGYGRIIQNTSILGVVAMPFRGAYSASKFALESFSSTLRQELSKTNIKVVIIAPGPIKSKLEEHAYEKYLENCEKNSVFLASYKRLEAALLTPKKAKERIVLGPEEVVKKVILGLESANPAAHYYIGFPAQSLAFLRRVLPDGLLDWILKKAARSEIE